MVLSLFLLDGKSTDSSGDDDSDEDDENEQNGNPDQVQTSENLAASYCRLFV